MCTFDSSYLLSYPTLLLSSLISPEHKLLWKKASPFLWSDPNMYINKDFLTPSPFLNFLTDNTMPVLS